MDANEQSKIITMPISARFITGVGSDGGSAPNPIGVSGDTGTVTVFKYRTSFAIFRVIFVSC